MLQQPIKYKTCFFKVIETTINFAANIYVEGDVNNPHFGQGPQNNSTVAVSNIMFIIFIRLNFVVLANFKS